MNPKTGGNNRVSTPSRVESENEVEDMDESGLSEEELDENQDGDDEPAQEGDSSDEDHDMMEEEDSSDMDATECEKKRLEYIDDLTDLEKQFAILREQLYRERVTQIETKLAEVKAGRANEYLQPLEELQINMKNRMEVSSVLRELRLANINSKFDSEHSATQQNFESEKRLLYDSIKDDLEEKIHILEEDKNNVDFSSGLWELNSMKSSSRRRKADPLDPDRRKKPVTVTGPYIVYMLHESEIVDDWTQIKKSLTQRKIHEGKLISAR